MSDPNETRECCASGSCEVCRPGRGGWIEICAHPSPTNLCRSCEIKRRAERLRAQGIEVRDV